MECRILESQEALAEWDAFVADASDGSFYQMSDWLSSYRAMGMIPRVLAVRDGAIIAGAGLLFLKLPLLPLSMAVSPWGPVFHDNERADVAECLFGGLKHVCRAMGALQIQVRPRVESDVAPIRRWFLEHGFREESTFPGFRTMSTALRIDLRGKTESELLEGFRSGTRRDIRRAERNGVRHEFATDRQSIERAWAIVEANATRKGYPVRSARGAISTFESLVSKNHGAVILGTYEGEAVSTAFVIAGGRSHVYALGGHTIAGEKSLASHWVQWQAIRTALQAGMDFYDLSSKTMGGVYEFKRGFRPDEYCVPSPLTFSFKPRLERVVRRSLNVVMPHRRKIADWLGRVRSVGRDRRSVRPTSNPSAD